MPAGGAAGAARTAPAPGTRGDGGIVALTRPEGRFGPSWGMFEKVNIMPDKKGT